MFETVIFVSQIIVAILLVGAILLQVPEGGLSPILGGGGEMYRSRRSLEKFLVGITITLATLLVVFSVVLLLPQLT